MEEIPTAPFSDDDRRFTRKVQLDDRIGAVWDSDQERARIFLRFKAINSQGKSFINNVLLQDDIGYVEQMDEEPPQDDEEMVEWEKRVNGENIDQVARLADLLKTWIERGYPPNLLPSKLYFQILVKLHENGDKKAYDAIGKYIYSQFRDTPKGFTRDYILHFCNHFIDTSSYGQLLDQLKHEAIGNSSYLNSEEWFLYFWWWNLAREGGGSAGEFHAYKEAMRHAPDKPFYWSEYIDFLNDDSQSIILEEKINAYFKWASITKIEDFGDILDRFQFVMDDLCNQQRAKDTWVRLGDTMRAQNQEEKAILAYRRAQTQE